MGSPVLEWSRLWSVCFPNSLSLRTSCIGVTSSPADRNHLKAVTALVTRRSNWYLWSRDFGLQGKTLVYSLNWPSLTRATLNSPTLSKSVCFSLASHSPFLLKPAPETRRQTPSSTVFFYPWNPSASTHPSSCLPTPLSNDPLYVPHEKSYPQSQSGLFHSFLVPSIGLPPLDFIIGLLPSSNTRQQIQQSCIFVDLPKFLTDTERDLKPAQLSGSGRMRWCLFMYNAWCSVGFHHQSNGQAKRSTTMLEAMLRCAQLGPRFRSYLGENL